MQINNVRYKNIKGSSNGEVAVTLRCSEDKPCKNITMEDITLWSQGGVGAAKLTNFCSNVNGASYGKQIPPSCLH